MELFIDWITRIVLFLLLAMVADALLPSGVMKNYARLVMSILLLLVFLGPLLQLLQIDPERLLKSADQKMEEQWDTGSLDDTIESKKNEILQGQDAYKLEQVTEALSAELAPSLKEEKDVTLQDTAMTFTGQPYSMETLEKVTLTISRSQEMGEVENVDISFMDEPSPAVSQEEDTELVKWVGTKLDLKPEQIEIHWEDQDE
ncbi:stage III sporulation protein AF [Halobacillus litoralis]|uniref:Stage III sporulation protein AF n=1 Tax=Halobacillus litoralis TaxID=45668 RepID=A0A845DQQ8_9BACI|nr:MULTISPECIES: stage III sporulation protein AF [Halobacillus]MYL19736.1 stage III sporulation protein AF [Halobacillus litoralis]MYL28882.1 stage III sporulation protein AF [Halobacillus halophilus]MYL37133.1 stage III sporulation protein AF [Halobacillus litoralis]